MTLQSSTSIRAPSTERAPAFVSYLAISAACFFVLVHILSSAASSKHEGLKASSFSNGISQGDNKTTAMDPQWTWVRSNKRYPRERKRAEYEEPEATPVVPVSTACSGVVVDKDGNACIDLHRELSGSFIYSIQRPDVRYLMCAIPKNGCSYHLGLAHRIRGVEGYEEMSEIHNNERKEGMVLSIRNSQTIADMLVDDSIPKYVVVRNPLQRTLAAYLDKVEKRMLTHQRTVENFHRWVYMSFPQNMSKRFWDGMNPHWRRQIDYCGFKIRDLSNYFKVFRAEEPEEYLDFLHKFMPEKYLKDGWGQNQYRNVSFREHVLGPRKRTTKSSEKLYKYFNNLKVFDHVADSFREDIDLLGYGEQVQAMRDDLQRWVGR